MTKKGQPSTGIIPSKYRNPVMHYRGASNYTGDYQVTAKALETYSISREHFGTTQINVTDSLNYRVKDYQYVLPDDSIGMRFLPVNDHGMVQGPDGEICGSALVDEMLRSEMELQPDDPMYALIYYFHPELNCNSIAGFATTEKMEMGITHLGAYLGFGRTSNSPPLYHDRVWGVKGDPGSPHGYPANVMILSLDGVKQAVLNKNLTLVDNFLNYGVRFPENYKMNKFRPVDINTALMFYRDWILEEPYLKEDPTWFTYCAAHKTLVANIGLNLPHNLESFNEIYGEDGADFYKALCKNYYELTGWPFEGNETTFEPLWKQQGLTTEQIKPLTLEEYEAYNEARRACKLKHFKGYQPQPPSSGTPWAPQMAADVIYDFVQTYADFIDAGAIATSATTYGFVTAVTERAKISKLEYLVMAAPIVQHVMNADARVHAAADPSASYKDSAYYKATFAALTSALGGSKKADPEKVATSEQVGLLHKLSWLEKLEKLAEGYEPEVLAWFSLMRVRDDWDDIMKGGCVDLGDAYVDMMDGIGSEFEKGRNAVVPSEDGIQYYAPPAIAHMVGLKMFAKNKCVGLRTVLTVMNYTELELKDK